MPAEDDIPDIQASKKKDKESFREVTLTSKPLFLF